MVPSPIPLFSQLLIWSLSRLSLVFSIFRIFVGIMAFFIIDVIPNITQVLSLVFFNHFYDIDSSSWVASLLVTFAFILFRDLSLRLTCIISGNKVLDGLSLVSILMVPLILTRFVFFGGFMTF